ncbi:MAG: pilus assembly protein TadG-related protein [Longimicrobiales bacterium]
MTGPPFPALDRNGSTFALFVVMLTGLLGAIALAVDVGMGFNARAEAQRVADAAALAGATAFRNESGLSGLSAENEANARALAIATANEVHGSAVLAAEVVTTPDWATKEVEVQITRDDIPAWFARFLGQPDIDVFARAVAKVSDGGTANQCVLPFSPPDIWDDVDADTVIANNLPDTGEEWDYDETVDNYSAWDGSPSGANGTGYGSTFRNGNGTVGDIGMRLYIKGGPPGQSGKGPGGSGGGLDGPFGPGNFLQWRMPDPDNNCEPRAGAQWVRQNIANCNSCPIGIGPDYVAETQPGNDAAIKDELLALRAEDPNAVWDTQCNCVTGSNFTNVHDSPRVRPIAFFDPTGIVQGQSQVEFTNLAWIFIEGGGTDPPDFAVYARFMGTVNGGEEGPLTGPLVQYLRLIE